VGSLLRLDVERRLGVGGDLGQLRGKRGRHDCCPSSEKARGE
jgi:hypothetical protein